MTRLKKILPKLYMALLLLFLYAPIFVVIFFSFNTTKSRTVFEGFTFQWYVELFHDDLIMQSFENSLILALCSSVLATVIGAAAALCIAKMKRFGRSVVMNVNYLPIVNSEVVTGVSLMLLFVFVADMIGGNLGFVTVLIAHTTFNLPYVVLNILPKLRQTDPHLLDAALDLGCTQTTAFFKVILPQILPAILSAFIMAFSLSFDDFAISYFTTGSSFQTLPVTIYSMTRKRITPKINALFTIIFLLVFLTLVIINLKSYRSSKKEVHV